MATIRSLDVAVRANTANFNRGMKSAESSLTRFGGLVTGIGGAVLRFGSILTAVATGALALWLRGIAKNIDETGKLADRIGISTEALTGLQHAAQITGVSAEGLGKSLQFLAKSLGEATTGKGEAKDALKLLNLEAKELIALSPDEQVKLLADRFRQLASDEERAFAATKLFGRAGVDLVNLLREGRSGIDALIRDAERLGLTFSREAAAKVEEANDQLTRLASAARGAGQTLVIELAPFIAAAANKLTEMATAGEGLGPKVVAAFEAIARSIAEVTGRFERLEFVVRRLARLSVGGALLLEGDDRTLAQVEAAATKRTADIANFFAEIQTKMEQAAQGKTRSAARVLEDTNEEIAKMPQAAQQAAASVAALLDGIIVRGQRAAEVLRGVLQNLLSIGLRRGVESVFAAAFGPKATGVETP